MIKIKHNFIPEAPCGFGLNMGEFNLNITARTVLRENTLKYSVRHQSRFGGK